MTPAEINRKISEMRGLEFDCCVTPDWTGSEDASAVLLEEMPVRFALELCPSGLWDAGIQGTGNWRASKDRKTAIALAWLACMERGRK